jgi:hypothetical protein
VQTRAKREHRGSVERGADRRAPGRAGERTRGRKGSTGQSRGDGPGRARFARHACQRRGGPNRPDLHADHHRAPGQHATPPRARSRPTAEAGPAAADARRPRRPFTFEAQHQPHYRARPAGRHSGGPRSPCERAVPTRSGDLRSDMSIAVVAGSRSGDDGQRVPGWTVRCRSEVSMPLRQKSWWPIDGRSRPTARSAFASELAPLRGSATVTGVRHLRSGHLRPDPVARSGEMELEAEQQGAERDHAERAARLREGGAEGRRPVVGLRRRAGEEAKRVGSTWWWPAAPGRELSSARYSEVSPRLLHVLRSRFSSFPDSLCRRAL